MEDKEGKSFVSLYCSLILPLLYRQMKRHFSPPQLPFSSLPIPPLPPTLRIPPPLPFPSYPSHLPRPSAPSHTITWLFFFLLLLFSLYSSLCLLPSFPSHFLLALPSPLHLSSLSPLSLLPFTILLFPFIVLLSFSSSSSSSSSFPLSWSSSSTFSSFSYFSPSPHYIPRPPVPSAPLPLTNTVPQLQQAKPAVRNLKRYVI